MVEHTLFLGLDVHKKTISVATVEDRAGAEVRFYGTIENTPDALRKLSKKLSQAGQHLHACYEAGPCGYNVQRHLTRLGHRCDVVAPSLIPRKSGERVRHWTRMHRRWLGELKFAHPAQHLALEEMLHRVQRAEELCDRLKQAIGELVPQWSLAPVVQALQALRGISLITAAVLVAEVGNFQRFDSPRQLMAYLGLNPSEHSSGATVRRGAITKTGNGLARTSLVEAAWTYRFPARITQIIRDRMKELPEPIRAVAWKAQVRLSARYRSLIARGKSPPIAIVAVARELVGFIWAIARMVEPKFT